MQKTRKPTKSSEKHKKQKKNETLWGGPPRSRTFGKLFFFFLFFGFINVFWFSRPPHPKTPVFLFFFSKFFGVFIFFGVSCLFAIRKDILGHWFDVQ